MEETNTVTEKDLDAILDSHNVNRPHANHLISDKVIDPKSAYFGQKGESYMLYLGGGAEQWYFKPKGNDDFIRVKWFVLESNVAEGEYGQAKYIGMNPSIQGKVGVLTYTNKKWVFNFEDEKYNLNSPESVEIL